MQRVPIKRVELPAPRYSYGGDEFVFVELDEEMSFQANFKAMAVCTELRKRGLTGVVEICPGNASYLVRFDADGLRPDHLVAELEAIDERVGQLEHYTFTTRVVDVPVLLEDPWTLETIRRFADRRQDPDATDVEYAARINGFKTKQDFLQALVGSPYFVTMVGFVPGTPWCFQMVPRERVIQVPKYVRPRTDTPERAFGYGGAFGCIYPVRGPGGYQLFGIFAAPIFDPKQQLEDFKDLIVFPRPGDIFKFRPIERDKYDTIRNEVEERTFRYRTREVEFDPEVFFADPDGFNEGLLARLYGD
jgi:allophanate hydrolase subunit 1